MEIEKYNIVIKIPEPMLQEDLEKFHTALQQKGTDDIPLSVYRRKVLEASEEIGWVTNNSANPYTKMNAGIVRSAAQEIIDEITKAQQLPPG